MKLRFAAEKDCRSLLAIYAQYIDTAVTFECWLPSEEEFTGRIRAITSNYPYLVCEDQGRIAGYAYAHRQMEREAYQWNAELSIYLDRAYTARGIGRRLYGALMELLRLQGVKNVYGGVTLPNAGSEGLHRALGCLASTAIPGSNAANGTMWAGLKRRFPPAPATHSLFYPSTGSMKNSAPASCGPLRSRTGSVSALFSGGPHPARTFLKKTD